MSVFVFVVQGQTSVTNGSTIVNTTTKNREKKYWKDVKQGNDSTLNLILRRREDFGWYRCIALRNDQSKKLTSNDVEIKCSV